MSVARGFSQNGKSYYTNVTKPIDVNLNFIVDSANGNGLGIRSLKSNGYVEYVFMNTSQTPGTVNGAVNPNPSAGYAIIKFKNNFNYYLGGFSGQIAPTSSTLLTSVTNHSPYIIANAGGAKGYVFTVTSANATQGATYTNNTQTFTVLATISGGTTLYMSGTGDPAASGTLTKASGTGDATITFSAFTGGAATTLAQWQAVGLTPGLTPTVGQSFIAKATQQIGGSAQVVAPGVLSATTVSVVGDPNQSINNSSIAANAGAIMLIQFSAPTAAGTTTLVAASPADNSVVGMCFRFDGSSVTIDGI